VEVNSRIHKVIDLGVNPNPEVGPTPLQEGFASARVSTLGPFLAAYVILSFHCTRNLVQGLRGGHGEPRYIDLPNDVARREVKHASDEKMRARRERENLVHCRTSGERAGVDTLPRFGSSNEGEGERETTLPPLSSMCITLPLLRDMVC
jgi:hypothetical protein